MTKPEDERDLHWLGVVLMLVSAAIVALALWELFNLWEMLP
jgi:hypothetical protein